jgi:uncharacterized protein
VSDDRILTLELAGETLLLHADRAVIWPARRTLLIADLHLGKSEFFRRSGIAVPEGSTAEDLHRLDALIADHAIERVVFLGDFVHAASSSVSLHAQALMRWREAHRQLSLLVVAGNHDRRSVHRELVHVVEWSARAVIDTPFVLQHHPARSADGYVLCGHIHPVTHLYGSRRERVRVPVLWRRPHYAVLPSFGSFTGGAEIDTEPEDQLFAMAAERVWKLP